MSSAWRGQGDRRTLSVTTDYGTHDYAVVSIETRPYAEWLIVTDGEPLRYGSYEVTLNDGETSTRGIWSVTAGHMDPKTFKIILEGTFQPTDMRLSDR